MHLSQVKTNRKRHTSTPITGKLVIITNVWLLSRCVGCVYVGYVHGYALWCNVSLLQARDSQPSNIEHKLEWAPD